MDAAEHYREAERLLADRPTAADWRDDAVGARKDLRDALAEAQVHATLALAATLREENASRRVVRRMGSPA